MGTESPDLSLFRTEIISDSKTDMLFTAYPFLNGYIISAEVSLLPRLSFTITDAVHSGKGKGSAFLAAAAAAALLLKGETVCTLGNCRVCLMCSHGNAVVSTVTLAVHIVLTGYYITFN